MSEQKFINESLNFKENFHEPFKKPKKIYSNILEAIGNTPLVKINKITKEEGIECEILAKCDYFNPAGSAKDRAAARMILDAEKKNLIKPNENYTLIEGTSGNTGIGLALISIVKGYNLICTLPKKFSQEKEDILTGMGSKVIRCENVPHGDPKNDSEIAKNMAENDPNKKSINLNQYDNYSNSMAHYDQTAEELIEQCDGKIDYFFVSPGTGGTMTGISHKLKEKIPNVKIIGVDPYGSTLGKPDDINIGGEFFYKIEGVGQGFVPRNCDLSKECVDEWVKVNDKDSFIMARRIIKKEGMLVGGSSGLVLAGTIEYCKKKKLGKDVRCIVFFCDGIRNYISKYLSDDWMIENNFMSVEEYDNNVFKNREDIKNVLPGKIKDIKDKLKQPEIVKDLDKLKVKDIINIFKEKNTNVILALNDKNDVIGYLSKKNVTCNLALCKATLNDECSNTLTKDVRVLNIEDPMYFLSRAMPRWDYLPVKTENDNYLIIEYENLYEYLLNNNK